jgi:eukaryotic-like serine/threonine-protein kinase
MNWLDQDNGTSDHCEAESSQVVAALEEYQAALRCGHTLDRAAFLIEHADVAAKLNECLDALELIQSVAGAVAPETCAAECGSLLRSGAILGDFRVVREIGRGGMGVVYEAEQLGAPELRVALKVLSAAALLDTRALQRFRVETQAAACLNHPNIVPVLAVGSEMGTPFYAMPLIKGRSLAEIVGAIRERRRKSTHSPEPGHTDGLFQQPWTAMVARLGVQAAQALEHAHSLGIIHRDVKPSNLLIDNEGRLWVTDFGLARITRDDRGLTRTGDLVGTLRYMSPEQVRGEAGAGDVRTDIYALGATLYEAITLRPIFQACDRAALLHRILHDEPVHPRTIDRTIPKDLETIILKAIDKLPSSRYDTAGELADDLHRLLDHRPIRARRPSAFERSLRWSNKHRLLLGTSVAGVMLCMAIGTVTLWRAKQQVEATLIKIRDARVQERLAFEGAIRINDTITIPLINDATEVGVWNERRRLDALRELVTFFDKVASTFEPDDHQLEVVAKAARRAGAVRMTIGEKQGRSDYAHSIELYEAMAAKTPAAIWYRTSLISTLLEYAGCLEAAGDREAASACRRRSYEVAEGLLINELATLPCFRKDVIPEFEVLVKALADGRDDGYRTLAARMTNWLNEHREPPARSTIDGD